MRVANHEDHITHAVIGGGEKMEAGVSDDPVFMQILSSTLYQNPVFAMVREILCNAWDAHISVDKTDVPVKVMVTDDEFVIRDFGPGIPRDKIRPIYLIYGGGSTKRQDSRLTGGFSLGSKAPWAYRDHFTVTSWCEGLQTVYAMSKSSGELMGKPGATPIVSIPSEETGLEVRIQLQPGDREKIENYVKHTVRTGELYVELNGKTLPIYPLNESPDGWLLVPLLTHQPNDRAYKIFIRCGAVAYPVESHNSYLDKYAKLTKILDLIESLSVRHCSFLIQGPPDRLLPMPSREAFSMQGTTLEAIGKTLDRVIADMEKQHAVLEEHAKEYTLATVKRLGKEGKIGMLLDSHARLLEAPSRTSAEKLHFTQMPFFDTLNVFSSQYAISHYPGDRAFYAEDLKTRREALYDLGFKDRGRLEALHQLVLKRGRLHGKYTKGNPEVQNYHNFGCRWVQKHIIRPLARDMQAAGLNIERTSFVDDYGMRGFGHISRGLALHTLCKIAVVHCRKTNERRWSYNGHLSKRYPELIGAVSYRASPSRGAVDKAISFFRSKGYTIVDEASNYVEELREKRNAAAQLPPEEKAKKATRTRKGYPALIGAISPGGHIRFDHCWTADSPRVLEPTCYHRGFRSRAAVVSAFTVSPFPPEMSRTILNIWGKDCAAIPNYDAGKKLSETLPDLSSLVLDTICKRVLEDKALHNYLAQAPDHIGYIKETVLSSQQRAQYKLLGTLFDNPILRKKLALTPAPSQETLTYYRLFTSIDPNHVKYYRKEKNEAYIKARVHVLQITPDQRVVRICRKLLRKFPSALSADTLNAALKPLLESNNQRKERLLGTLLFTYLRG